MSIRQFAFHSEVSKTPPVCRMSELYAKCKKDVKSLTSAERQEIFDKTREHKGTYKIIGWAFNFVEFMNRFVVCTYGSWSTVYAFNKTNIRKNMYTKTGITEIHEIPKR